MNSLRFARVPLMCARRACSAWVVVASVLLGFDPPQILLYADPQDYANGSAETVAREACPYLRAEGVPLPVPFEVRWLRKDGESQRYVPDPERRAAGLLTACPPSASPQRPLPVAAP